MTIERDLGGGVILRSLASTDAAALAHAYASNRDHLEPWEPTRPPSFRTESGQRAEIDLSLANREAGTTLPVVLDHDGQIVGRATLSGIVRGAAQSANLGYWVDHRYTGRGLMTATVEAVAQIARSDLRLHRIQAATLLHNVASQTVLTKCGFTEIGLAPEYLEIAGRWQDHRLFQRILSH